MRTGLVLLASILITGARLCVGWAADPSPEASLRQLVPTIPPPAEQTAIKLSGHTPNPAAEAWQRTTSPRRPGVAWSATAELIVRNVSQPTLAPFLPTPSKASGAAMIVVPGGGFIGLAIEREGYSVARWLAEQGIAAFVLKYRVAPTPADPHEVLGAVSRMSSATEHQIHALQDGGVASEFFSKEQRDGMAAAREDALEAIRYVRGHAANYGISPDRIGIMGFSAGAITAVGVTLHADAASQPNLVAPIYGTLPDHTEVPQLAPPAFIATAGDDASVPYTYSYAIYNAWRKRGISAELHIFEQGGHGFGLLHQQESSDQWPELFGRWLKGHGFEK